MCNGTRLDPVKQLAAYKLPVVSQTRSKGPSTPWHTQQQQHVRA